MRALAAALLIGVAGAAAAQTPGAQAPATQTPATGTPAEPESFHVFLVTWRGETSVERGFKAHMQENGIPVSYTERDLERDRSRIPEVVAEIQAAQPDLVHTFGTTATVGIFGRYGESDPATHVQGIPGVFSIVAYPIEARIVESFESTGRPLTGTAFLPPVERQLDALLAYRSVERLGVVYNSLETNSRINVEQLRSAAEERGIELVEAPVPLDDEDRADATRLDEAVDRLAGGGVEFMYIGPDSFVTLNRAAVTGLAAERGIPTVAGTEATFEGSQAVLGFVSRYYLVGKLAGAQAARILIGGERPEDLPVASLARFALLIRMSTALEMEVYPPLSLLRIAQVVEE